MPSDRSGELDDFDEQVFAKEAFTLSHFHHYKELEEEKLPFSSKGGSDDGWGRFDLIVAISRVVISLIFINPLCFAGWLATSGDSTRMQVRRGEAKYIQIVEIRLLSTNTETLSIKLYFAGRLPGATG